jgi:hypothetical protein
MRVVMNPDNGIRVVDADEPAGAGCDTVVNPLRSYYIES